MKRISVLIMLTVMVFAARAQRFRGKIANHSKGEMDVVLTLFGFEKLVKIGTLSEDGNLEIDLFLQVAVNQTRYHYQKI